MGVSTNLSRLLEVAGRPDFRWATAAAIILEGTVTVPVLFGSSGLLLTSILAKVGACFWSLGGATIVALLITDALKLRFPIEDRLQWLAGMLVLLAGVYAAFWPLAVLMALLGGNPWGWGALVGSAVAWPGLLALCVTTLLRAWQIRGKR